MDITLRTFSLTALCCILGTGCAASGDRYPSLATRDAERVAGQLTPTQSASPPPAPVATSNDLNTLIAAARRAHERFLMDRPSAQRLVRSASGLGIETDARARAEVALAGLTSLRSETYRALGELDRLQAEAATTFAPSEDIIAAQAEITQLVATQGEVIGRLQSELAP